MAIGVYFWGWTQKIHCQNTKRNTSTLSSDTSLLIQSLMKRYYLWILVNSWVYSEETWDSCLDCLVLQAFLFSTTTLVHLLLRGNGWKCKFEINFIGIVLRQNGGVWNILKYKQLFFLTPATEILSFTRINRRWQFALSPNYVVIVILWIIIKWLYLRFYM